MSRGRPAAPRDQAAPLQQDHALLLAAVREAGQLAHRYFIGGARSWEKKPNDPVSEADLAVDRLLRERLQGARPDYGWLSEETIDDASRLTARRVWIVDPIDGTRAFLRGRPEFTICAALVDQGAPIAAAVYNPATDEFFEAEKGAGARLNGVAMQPSGQVRLAGSRLIASQRTFERYRWTSLTPGAEFAYMNSIAYRMVKVAAGAYDAAVTLTEKSDWDIAAADLILQEAGAICTTADGGRFLYNRPVTRHPSVLASNPGLHATLVELLQRR